MSRVLAIKADGTMTYCTCPPERRGKGNCPHIYHQNEGESVEDFMQRVSFAMTPVLSAGEEGRTQQEITKELINDNILSFNQDPDWGNVVDPMLKRFLRIGDTVFDGHCITKVETNEDGDLVDHLYIVGKFGDFEFSEDSEDDGHQPCDFGEIPHIREDGTFSIKGVDYRCLPVVSRNKVGYGQGYSADGSETVWLYQEDGNLAVTIPVEGDTCKIFGKTYKKSEIEDAINNPPHKDPKVALLLSCIDPRIKDRIAEYGEEPGWMNKITDNFKCDTVNDLEFRRVYTYEDQVQKELFNQVRRMGTTLRGSIVTQSKQLGLDGSGKKTDAKIADIDPEKMKVDMKAMASADEEMRNSSLRNGGFEENGIKPILYQKNNTKNIRDNLLGRSNVQMAETLNPLAAYSQAHKVTLVGLEGYNKDNCPDSLRMVNDSLKGICDPLDQSSGKGIGLSIFLKGSDVKNGVITRDPSKNCFSLSDFVPYRNHNNPNRVSMATSQMRQAMPLTEGEDPRRLGDPVSDKAWSTISGAKMGRNLRVAYLTGEKEWEDSAEISESAAKKLSANKKFTFQKDPRYKGGMNVKAGDKIAGKTVKYDGMLKETPSGFEMEVTVPFTAGNKIAGRFGNKCTVGRIVPDNEMPQIWNSETKKYEPAEIIMSPLSIGKRGNIGAILETQNDSLSSKDIVPVRMPNGKTVKANNGTQFIMRLNQISQEKNHAYDGELTDGREAKARFGEMESILLTTTEKRRQVLNYLKNQGTDEQARLDSLLKAIGVSKKNF